MIVWTVEAISASREMRLAWAFLSRYVGQSEDLTRREFTVIDPGGETHLMPFGGQLEHALRSFMSGNDLEGSIWSSTAGDRPIEWIEVVFLSDGSTIYRLGFDGEVDSDDEPVPDTNLDSVLGSLMQDTSAVAGLIYPFEFSDAESLSSYLIEVEDAVEEGYPGILPNKM